MPPSGRGKTKTRLRKATEANISDTLHEEPESEPVEPVATPTRSSRKRARGGAEPARNVRRKTNTRIVEREDTEEAGQSDNETQPAYPTEQDIIASLKVAERHVNATEDFANNLLEGQENVPGYGKIAGRDWAFIVRKLEVNIGRPEAHERAEKEAQSSVDIDLGPDRQVSRSHAVIAYDSEGARWYIVVSGRNGLRIDKNLYKKGTKCYLRNGSVVEIAGTQMAFITSTGEDSEGPVWETTIVQQAQKSEEEGHATALLPSEHSHGNAQPGRAHPHSSRAAASSNFQLQPGTPTRMMSSQYGKSSPNGGFARGIAVESTESIDYSSNGAKDLKPPHSYAQLIGMAILSTTDQQMTLNNIYKWIMANYAFYRFNTGGWQNSIRHNLSLNKAFTKIARRTDEPGKGMKWMIEPKEFDSFVGQGMKGCRRPPVQAAPSSQQPAPQALPDASSPLAIRNARADATPPLPQWRAADTSTPGHVGKIEAEDSIDDAAETLDFLRTTPRNGLPVVTGGAGSPPALFVPDDGRVASGMDTPFPLKPAQRLVPPSSLKRPSDFIQFSSPAPFWKMEGLVGTTPWKFDVSPMKTPFTGFDKVPKLEADDSKMSDEQPAKTEDTAASTEPANARVASLQDRQHSPVIPSSSPPRPSSSGLGAVMSNGSPTATRPASRLAQGTTQSAKGLNLLAAATHEAERSTSQPPSLLPAQPVTSRNVSTPQNASDAYDDGEDEGIDLAKGFQPIGAFHHKQRVSQFGAMQPMTVNGPNRASFGH